MSGNTEAYMKKLKMQIGQMLRQWETKASSNEICKAIVLRNKVVTSNPKVSDETKQSSEVEIREEKRVIIEEGVIPLTNSQIKTHPSEEPRNKY